MEKALEKAVLIIVFLVLAIALSGCTSTNEASPVGQNEPVVKQEPLDINAIKQDALEISWEELMRYNEKYIDKIVHLKGVVIQTTEENNMYIMFSIDDFGQESVVVRFKDYNSTRILEDDDIAVWGKVKGLYTYTTVLRSKKTVPELEGLLVELLPKRRR